ncbi:MAG: ATP-binding cassette domain-containing protein [Planctomycetota bacterium]
MAAPTVRVRGVSHAFGAGSTAVEVLHGIDLELRGGEVVVLMGPSGSGKTTLLTLIGCLRTLQQGSVELLGEELLGAEAETLIRLRRRLGFIFQAHNLHGSLTAIQNVRMGLEVQGPEACRDWRARCTRALELVGLGHRLDFLPEELSGGQKQRVAVARAVVGDPDLVFADEPTAALDKDSGTQVMQLLRRLADRRGVTVLIVTHDRRILPYADRIVRLEDGRLVGEQPVQARALADAEPPGTLAEGEVER